jgi:transposase-like protein
MFAKVEEWKNSGKSLRSFASSIGISASVLSYWVCKKRKSSISLTDFLELTSLAQTQEDVVVPSKHLDSAAQAQIVITFPSGMSVKIYG